MRCPPPAHDIILTAKNLPFFLSAPTSAPPRAHNPQKPPSLRTPDTANGSSRRQDSDRARRNDVHGAQEAWAKHTDGMSTVQKIHPARHPFRILFCKEKYTKKAPGKSNEIESGTRQKVKKHDIRRSENSFFTATRASRERNKGLLALQNGRRCNARRAPLQPNEALLAKKIR